MDKSDVNYIPQQIKVKIRIERLQIRQNIRVF